MRPRVKDYINVGDEPGYYRKIFNISIFSVFINLYINVPVFCPLHALFISSSSSLSVHPPVLSFPQKVLSKYVIDFLE